jgi:hypothetical protein
MVKYAGVEFANSSSQWEAGPAVLTCKIILTKNTPIVGFGFKYSKYFLFWRRAGKICRDPYLGPDLP